MAAEGGRGGLLVHTTNDQLQQLKDKMLLRRSSIIKGLLPQGSGALAGELPRRLHYGPEGSDGDARHEQAMERVLLKFGDSHVEDRAWLVSFTFAPPLVRREWRPRRLG